jgi:hypothetical protein
LKKNQNIENIIEINKNIEKNIEINKNIEKNEENFKKIKKNEENIEKNKENIENIEKKKEINIFKYNHIISKDNILPIILTNGPTLKEFNFTFESKEDIKNLDEIGIFIITISKIIPDGKKN